MLQLAALGLVFFASTRHSIALMEIDEVSKERAKELGTIIRSHTNGQSGVRVTLEFQPQGRFQNFTRVDLEINDGTGQKRLVDASLLPSYLETGAVSVSFSADPQYLATSCLTIVVTESARTRIGYRFKVKDFVAPERRSPNKQ